MESVGVDADVNKGGDPKPRGKSRSVGSHVIDTK
jgi:hypothetical protein